jgi:putative addiction module component (TIGR02574 family)
MTTQADDILRNALNLAPSERAEIAASLIASLDADTGDEIEAAWAAEIKRRIDQIDQGEVQLVPADEVMRSMRERMNG